MGKMDKIDKNRQRTKVEKIVQKMDYINFFF